MMFDAHTLYGILSVGLMVAFYTFEDESVWLVLGFALACTAAAVCAFLLGHWPLGALGVIWAFVALKRWQKRRLAGKPAG